MEFMQYLENYFSVLQTKIELNNEVKSFYGKILAPEFNSFKFWSIDENKVSEILSFFLDPKASHNQGVAFLNIFLKKLELFESLSTYDLVEVQSEFPTDKKRRLDIAIIFGDYEFIIGIENKIYENTADQNNQIQHYSDYLSQITNNNYLLIYLTPASKLISNNSISEKNRKILLEQKKFVNISYEHEIIDCIHEFSLSSESDRVRAFLQDFEKTLKQMYIGEDFMNENEIIIKYAFQNIENLKLTLRIGNAAVILKDNLYQKLDSQFSEIGKELDVKYVQNKFTFIPNSWNNCEIKFSFEMNGLIYGIFRKERNIDRERNEEIETALGGKWNVSNWFLCYKFLLTKFEANPVNFINIENGTLKTQIKQIVSDIVEKLNDFEM